MITLFSTFFIYILTGSLAVADHNVHISKCEINELNSEGKLELQVSIFYDDLLEAVGLTMGEELPEDYKSADELIEAFIKSHLVIEINGIEKAMDYIESHSYPPAVWTTLEIDQKEDIKELKIKNTILLDQFDDQKNIISLPWKGKTKTVALDHKNHLFTLKL
jgi:hypothetical protein